MGTEPAIPDRQRSGAVTEMKLEVVVLPVSDVDRSKAFYQRLGWRLDADFPIAEDYRVVQFTPPGSGASIQFGDGLTTMAPGSVEDLFLAVDDLDATRGALMSRGADVSEVWHGRGPGTEGHEPGPDPEHSSYRSFASFSDPDGNRWLLQEIKTRLEGRVTGASFASVGDLARALRRAEGAHGEHERATGIADPDWPSWYAHYMVAEQTGEALPT